jgi:muramoyltetrapeptide carboxypeptidase
MGAARVRIGIVATGSRFVPETADRVRALAAERYGERVELLVHSHSGLSDGHFAGTDAERLQAFLETANDPTIDAVWFARGGYGAGRLVEAALPQLTEVARAKRYLGFSDAGALLGALYAAGFTGCAHGPLANDILREGGEAAVLRALSWLADRDPSALDPSIDGAHPTAAFNLTILSTLIGTPWQPDLSGHVLMLEEVSEHMYRIDRLLMHVTSNADIRRVAGLRLGRCTLVPENDPPFGHEEEAVARFWCERSGIPWLGRADIGHDAQNRVVPYGWTPQP